MRWPAIALLLFATGCMTTTSVTRSGTGLFAPKGDAAEEDDEAVPRGLSLSAGVIASDGTVTLELRNYSDEPFVFRGTPDHPQLVLEVQDGNTHSRQTMSPWSRRTHTVSAGERLQLETNVGGIPGRLRLGIRSHEFGYVVWTGWMR